MPPLPPKCNHLSPSALLPANLSHHCFLPGLLQVPPTILSVSALALLTSVFYTAARINLLKHKSYPKTEVIPPVFSHLTQQRSFSDLSGLTQSAPGTPLASLPPVPLLGSLYSAALVCLDKETPQDLRICCTLCLEFSSPSCLYGLLPLFYVSTQTVLSGHPFYKLKTCQNCNSHFS